MPLDIVPRVGLGTDYLGVRGDRKDAFDLLDAFLGMGGTLLDTAQNYSDWVPGETGRSETIIGEWLTARGNRSKVRISTKGGHFDATGNRLDPASLRHDVEQSLRRLRTDHLDIYFLHRDDHAAPVADIFGTLGRFVEEGKIGATGGSNWDAARLAEARRLPGHIPTYNQPIGHILVNRMNPPRDATQRALDGAAVRLAEAGDMTIMPYSSQCHGAFVKVAAGQPLREAYDNPACRQLIADIFAVAAAKRLDANDMVLAFLTHFSPNITPLVGPKSVELLQATMRAFDVRIDTETVAQLAAISGFADFRTG